MSRRVCACACVQGIIQGYNVYGFNKRQSFAFGYLLQEIGLASATGGYWVLVCNVATFLVKLVSCTTYGATLWDSVGGYGVFPRRFYSDCTDQFLFCQQNNYFLDVNSLSHYY